MMNRNFPQNRFIGGFGFPFFPFLGGLAVGSLLAPRPIYYPPYPYYAPYPPYPYYYR
ncbi:hypothetical protein M3936_02625 [Sutcliffiella horikoshii]|uniref:hypothetical protein n=1 Tax=Sutcliffiella horikoshii TaxID=79883 RepID=UPI0012E802C3|nr:hypothetical protein [Sutcliffiella horikoshii]MCM3616468.1 hypothetical protein [Sutcliffiella horikoshii]